MSHIITQLESAHFGAVAEEETSERERDRSFVVETLPMLLRSGAATRAIRRYYEGAADTSYVVAVDLAKSEIRAEELQSQPGLNKLTEALLNNGINL